MLFEDGVKHILTIYIYIYIYIIFSLSFNNRNYESEYGELSAVGIINKYYKKMSTFQIP